jgi:hypothetical protein
VKGRTRHACYWKNGTAVLPGLPAGASDGTVYSISVLQGKVYVSGICENAFGVPTSACYRVDGQRTDLELNGANGSWANSMFVR